VTIRALQENPFGKVHPLMELRNFLPEGIDLGQELGILRRLDTASQPVGEGFTHGADGEKEERPPSKYERYGEYAFHVHSVLVSGNQAVTLRRVMSRPCAIRLLQHPDRERTG
jgi:hypothetical protein